VVSLKSFSETIQRVRYREGYDKEVFMKKGKVYEVNLTAMSTSNMFKKGHRIRIEISSSNFPRFARNLNTGVLCRMMNGIMRCNPNFFIIIITPCI